MKKHLLLAAFALFSSVSMAQDICYTPQEGQDPAAAAKAKKDYEDNVDAKALLSTCAGPLLMGSSPKEIADMKCEDGSYPCTNAVKILCKKKLGVPVGKDPADTWMCQIFGFLL